MEALESAHPQDIVRVLRVAGSWTRLQYVAAITSEFRGVWDDVAGDAHRLVKRLLAAALGGHAAGTSKLTLAAAFTPEAKGGLGLPAPYVEVSFAADRREILELLDDPTKGGDAAEERREALAKRRGYPYDTFGTLLAAACESSDLATVRVAHQARDEVRRLWSVNACERDRTIADSLVAAKVLDGWLFGSLVESEYNCGEAAPFCRRDRTMGPYPEVGPVGRPALHVHGCLRNRTVLHDLVRDVVADVGNSVAKGCVLTEQGIDERGQPYTASKRLGHVVPGDVVVRKGRSGPWIYGDVTVVLNEKGLADEAELVRNRQHRMVLTERAHAGKQGGRNQGERVASSFGDYRPMAVSAFGAFDAITEQSLQHFAAAVDTHTDVPEPYREPSTASRLMAAVSWNVHVGTAAFALTFPRGTTTGAVPFRAATALSERMEEAIRAPLARDPDWWAVGRRAAVLRSLDCGVDGGSGGGTPSPEGSGSGSIEENTVAELQDALRCLASSGGGAGAVFDAVGPVRLARGAALARPRRAARPAVGRVVARGDLRSRGLCTDGPATVPR